MDLDPQERHIAAGALRNFIDRTGYGQYITDAIVQGAADAVVIAVESHRKGVAQAPKAEGRSTGPSRGWSV